MHTYVHGECGSSLMINPTFFLAPPTILAAVRCVSSSVGFLSCCSAGSRSGNVFFGRAGSERWNMRGIQRNQKRLSDP